MSSPKSLKLSSKDLSGKRVAASRAKASGLRPKPEPSQTRQDVLDRLKDYMCSCRDEELAALGEVFETATFLFIGEGDALEMRIVFVGRLTSLEFAIPAKETLKTIRVVEVDGPVLDYAQSMLRNLSLNVYKLMDDWSECADKDGPSDFVIPLRDE